MDIHRKAGFGKLILKESEGSFRFYVDCILDDTDDIYLVDEADIINISIMDIGKEYWYNIREESCIKELESNSTCKRSCRCSHGMVASLDLGFKIKDLYINTLKDITILEKQLNILNNKRDELELILKKDNII